MNKKQAEKVYKWRRAIIDNLDKIFDSVKSSKKLNNKNPGQFTLFDQGLKDVKEYPKIEPSDDPIDAIEWVNKETEAMGLSVLYDPLDELWMYEELYCTHNPVELLALTEKTKNIFIMDRIVNIDYRTSLKGNKYCKLFLSKLGETYIYLWGQNFRDYISRVFIENIYLIQVTFNTPTKDFDRYSYVCTDIKNIKDVDIESEISRLIKQSNYTEMNEWWMFKNRKPVNFSEIKIGNPFRSQEGDCFADFIKVDYFNARCFGGFHKKFEIGETYELAIDRKCIRLFTNEDQERITEISLGNED